MPDARSAIPILTPRSGEPVDARTRVQTTSADVTAAGSGSIATDIDRTGGQPVGDGFGVGVWADTLPDGETQPW